MLTYLFDINPVMVLGVVATFVLTFVCILKFKDRLPYDKGREFAVDGTLSKGKARGAGIIFVLVFALCDVLFNTVSIERYIYLAVIVLCMLTGYLDDAATKAWNEYLKGALDLILAIIVAVTYLTYHGNSFRILSLFDIVITLPYWLAGLLIVALVWCAINVTNCTDGVDGLSATLTTVTLFSFALVIVKLYGFNDSAYSVLLFCLALAAYLWFNANPSTVLMGDAGSRAMGMMIAIIALLSGRPLLYIPFSLVMILDGGLGLIKVALLRFLKISILKNVRCPLHDQARKVNGWSGTQVCYRFTLIQLALSVTFAMLEVLL